MESTQSPAARRKIGKSQIHYNTLIIILSYLLAAGDASSSSEQLPPTESPEPSTLH